MWPFRDIHAKLDRIAELQAHHSALLAEHERRSVALEAAQADLRREITPLKAHVAAWAGVGKSITILGALAGLSVAVWRLLGL